MSKNTIDVPLNDSGMTELHLGAAKQELDWVKSCVEAGFDVNKRSGNGYTPLVWAIDMACTSKVGVAESIIDYLIANGADLSDNPTRFTSLIEFADSTHPDIGKYIRQKVECN